MEENLKKALSELMVLALLHEREYYALELAPAISEYSGGIISITFPYSILYRMIEQQYIQELPKRTAPDGRRRQYFGITEAAAALRGGRPSAGWQQAQWRPSCWKVLASG